MFSILRNNPVSRHVARRKAVCQEIQPIEFDDDAIMSKIISMPVRFFGYYLRVPAGTHAVVTYPSGQLRIFGEGDRHLNLPSGNYEMRYVNMKELLLPLEIQGETRDGLDVSLQLNIFWRVTNPKKVVVLESPTRLLRSWCTSAVRDYLRGKSHDLLTQPSARGPVRDRELVLEVRQQLDMHLIETDFFEVIDILPVQRQGDGHINRARQQAEVQKRSLAFQTSVLEAQQQVDVQQLGMDQELSQMRAGQARWEAENEASTEVEVQKILSDIRRQQWQYKQEALADEREFELHKKSIDASGSAIGQVYGTMLEAQCRGVQQGDASTTNADLSGMMENLVANLSMPGNGAGPTADSASNRSGSRTIDVLKVEVADVAMLPGKPRVVFQEVKEGLWSLNVEIGVISITISCHEGYPERRPQAQFMVGRNPMAIPVQAPILERANSLADIVKAVQAQVRSEQAGDGWPRGPQRSSRMSAD